MNSMMMIVVAAIISALIVIAALVMLLGKKRAKPLPANATPMVVVEPANAVAPGAPTAGSPEAPASVSGVVVSITGQDAGTTERFHGAPADDLVGGGVVRLSEPVRSARRLEAGSDFSPGDVLEAKFSVRASGVPANGAKLNFFVGPVFFDAAMQVVGWWQEQAPLSVEEGARAGRVAAVAPPEATFAYLALHGSNDDPRPEGAEVLLEFAALARA